MKEPKKIPIIDEDEYIDCPKCGKHFKTWSVNIVYREINREHNTDMSIYCPRCGYITKRRPLDWSIKE